jgi:hypothetical protein
MTVLGLLVASSSLFDLWVSRAVSMMMMTMIIKMIMVVMMMMLR